MKLQDKNLYYVGGVVRDEILGVKSIDTDFCYEGNAIEFAQKKNLNIIKINPDFGTVRVLFEGKEIDIASTREETYPKAGHLPSVKNIGCSLEKDLKRRDFTINSISKNTLTGEIFDPFNGIEDIKNKTLKILHKNSFADDPTRIIRGLKFGSRFGFTMDSETYELQQKYLSNINYDMSYHRLKKELAETFNQNIGNAYDTMLKDKSYLLIGKEINPAKINGKLIEKITKDSNIESPWIIYLACLNYSLDGNLPLTRSEKKIIEWANKLETQKQCNNTPRESIVINSIKRDFIC